MLVHQSICLQKKGRRSGKREESSDRQAECSLPSSSQWGHTLEPSSGARCQGEKMGGGRKQLFLLWVGKRSEGRHQSPPSAKVFNQGNHKYRFFASLLSSKGFHEIIRLRAQGYATLIPPFMHGSSQILGSRCCFIISDGTKWWVTQNGPLMGWCYSGIIRGGGGVEVE